MKQYLNELAPWERKKEYYHHIQLGKDVRSQTEAINNQTKAMISAQLASSNAIIARTNLITSEIRRSIYKLHLKDEVICI